MRTKEYIENLINKGKHFCIHPWVHLHVTGFGRMAPCCRLVDSPNSMGYGDLNTNSIHELWQGEAIRNFRLKMLNDEMDELCKNCYEIDKVSSSFRKFYNFKFHKYADWVADTDDTGYAPRAKPISWDIRFSNLCNLRCRTCGSGSSSSWYKDEKALGILNSNVSHEVMNSICNSNAFLADLEQYYPYVETIYFAGGEPLLFKENLVILEKLASIQRYDVELTFNTNITQFNKSNRFLELWKKYKRLGILASLDGSGKRCEYLRKGLEWNNVLNNLDYLKKECPHAEVINIFTVSAFNILHLPDFHKEMIAKRYFRADKIHLNILHESNHYNIRILPEELKKQAAQKIKEHIVWLKRQNLLTRLFNQYQHNFGQWYGCIDYMNSENWTHLIPEFIEYTNKLDALRNEKCLDIFPELEPIFHIN